MWIAQISDLHVTPEGGATRFSGDTGVTLARCVAALAAADPPPRAVVASGDLAGSGTPAEYARLRALLEPLTMPVYLLPGNHDDREALRAAFADCAHLPRRGPLCYAVEVDALRLAMLDTAVPGRESGALDDDQLRWLESVLADGRPTVLFMHHPPLRTGLHGMDDIALEAASAARLRDIVRRHPHVERIACGHVHRVSHARWAGTVVTVCPSTAFQARVAFGSPWRFAATAEPPAYHVHYWNGEALVTHTVSISGGERRGSEL